MRIDESDETSPARAVGATVVLSVFVATAMLVGAMVTRGVVHQTFLVLAICTPGLYIQDAWRFVLFAMHRPFGAAVNDSLWLVFQVAGFVLLHVEKAESIESLGLVWGGSACLCAVIGGFQVRRIPLVGSHLTWVVSNRAVGFPFAAEFLVYSGSGQLAILVVAAFAGWADLGAFRAAMALFGPLQVMVVGLNIAVLAEGKRLLRTSPRNFRNLLIGYSASAALLGVIFGGVLAALPNSVGTALTGTTWPLLHRLVGTMTVFISLWIATAAPAAGLRVLRATKRTLGARSVVCVLLLIFALAGVNLWGIQGAIVGFGLSQAIGLFLWWREFLRALRATTGAPALVS